MMHFVGTRARNVVFGFAENDFNMEEDSPSSKFEDVYLVVLILKTERHNLMSKYPSAL